jgi:uncharacterized protein with PQ loop repeat
MLSFIAPLAACSGVLTALSPLIQIAAMLKSRSSRGLSLPFLAIGLCNGAIWLSYAVALGNQVMVVSNSVGVTIGVLFFAVTLALRRSERHAAAPAGVDLAGDIARLEAELRWAQARQFDQWESEFAAWDAPTLELRPDTARTIGLAPAAA